MPSASGLLSVGGVDGWADDVPAADGFQAPAPAQVDPAVTARAMEHAAHISGVDGFELEPAAAKPAAAKPEAAAPAPPAAPEGPEVLRIEQGGPSGVAVVTVLCRLAKIKRPGQL